MLLRERRVQPFSGQEEELDHADIGRQRIRVQRAGIGEIRIAAEQAVDHRRDEAPFQQALRPRLFQRQRGEEGQVDGAVGGGAGVERVGDVVGLAEPERQADHEVGADIADDVLRNVIGVGEFLRHRDSVWSNKAGIAGSPSAGFELSEPSILPSARSGILRDTRTLP